MFNHSDNPNITWYFTNNNEIEFKATKSILYGQQLTIDYGKKYWNNRKDKI
tara:strand:+ start:266 stop:418 length:153 start_codon:yes stop_codon:yes gene_type:complete